jgi:hypothetical protein
MPNVEIVVLMYDPADKLDPALVDERKLYPGAAWAQKADLQLLLDKVLGSLRPGDLIERLVLSSHGSPSSMEFGDGSLDVDLVRRARSFLRAWYRSHRGRFAPYANLDLDGCDVGKTFDLARELSSIFSGVRVRAGIFVQDTGYGFEGPVVTCVDGACRTSNSRVRYGVMIRRPPRGVRYGADIR